MDDLTGGHKNVVTGAMKVCDISALESVVEFANENNQKWYHPSSTTTTKDDARDKAVASHETMGLVSALLAGFEQSLCVRHGVAQVRPHGLSDDVVNDDGVDVVTVSITLLATFFQHTLEQLTQRADVSNVLGCDDSREERC